MVSNSAHRRRGPLTTTRRPLRSELALASYWLLAGLVLPVAGVAGVVWLVVPLGYAAAIAVVIGIEVVALAAAAAVFARLVPEAGRARLAAIGVLVAIAMTWVLLAMGYIVLVTGSQ